MKLKYKNIIYVSLLSACVACADSDPLEFEVDKPASIAQQEEIDAYEPLKDYVNKEGNASFKLGAGITLAEYNDQGVIYRLVNNNFDEITIGYGMKHGAIVQDDGRMDMTNVKKLVELSSANNLSIYGHTLCWHANQNAGYLNTLISPLIVTAPSFPNALDISGLYSGSFDGWQITNSGQGVEVLEGMGMGSDTKAISLQANASASAAEDLQLVSPEIVVEEGHTYEVIMYIKSDKEGEGRISFDGLSNNKPQIDWKENGVISESFTTNISWQRIKFKVNDFNGSTFHVKFDLGYQPDVTYYIDINNLYVYDTQGEAEISNLIANGDFEAGNAWGGWGSNLKETGFTATGQGVGGAGRAFYVTTSALSSNYWDVQTSYPFDENLTNGQSYKLSFWVKGEVSGTVRPEIQSSDYSSNSFGQVQVSTEWKKVELETIATSDTRERLIISYGEFDGTVYFDDFVLKPATSNGGNTTTVEKTPEEKKEILSQQLNNWIEGIMTASKSNTHAWDVVNEPMDDGNPYELKSGIGKELPADHFYWQDYLGKDYAVEAFTLARKYGNDSDLLFINDYNLEYNLDKCKGLIEYVKYIEKQGVKVDGIGTQMHISLDTDKTNIAEMFKLLAGTGKMIKVSELDIRLGTPNPSWELLQQQADMYNYVVDMYNQHIQANQRYGITVWGITDSAEDASWLPGESQSLWTQQLVRKPAYVGVANGLKEIK
ncbi:endo-1,4-beta-xylanase [Fulvivirga sediminis]|uniref:endo-1,4-beta-xylanase n=1 Tax=Fulvivirga sediminis TaxID=2803949 RepID=A0A937F904_9BACT|nr:endo-1,4-beta-xylanase [Fulvivirga sediminis]MBL3657232.1 endo-1,4-beta-xylanase [Fulvivirga sediminis]